MFNATSMKDSSSVESSVPVNGPADYHNPTPLFKTWTGLADFSVPIEFVGNEARNVIWHNLKLNLFFYGFFILLLVCFVCILQPRLTVKVNQEHQRMRVGVHILQPAPIPLGHITFIKELFSLEGKKRLARTSDILNNLTYELFSASKKSSNEADETI